MACYSCGTNNTIDTGILINNEPVDVCQVCIPSLFLCPVCSIFHNTSPISQPHVEGYYTGVWAEEDFYLQHIYVSNINNVFNSDYATLDYNHNHICSNCIQILVQEGTARRASICGICESETYNHNPIPYFGEKGHSHICNTCIDSQRWCVICQEWHSINGITYYNINNNGPFVDIVCANGLKRTNQYMCSGCSQLRSNNIKRHPTQQGDVCQVCYDSMGDCPTCGHRMIINEDTGMCHQCTRRHCRECDDCGKLRHSLHINNMRDSYLCYECYWKRSEMPIGGYTTRIKPEFFGDGDLFFGIELELDFSKNKEIGRAMVLGQEWLAKHGNQHCIIVHDGSIERGGGSGYEVVTQPMSFEYLKEWDLAEKCIPKEIRKFTPTVGCGIHIHMSKDPFTKAQLYRFLTFIYDNDDYMFGITRRLPDARYCRKEEVVDNFALAEGTQSTDKYVQVNLSNRATVELRMFKGTHNAKVLYSYIEFAKALFEYTANNDLRKEDMSNILRFTNYVAQFPGQYPHLIHRNKYLIKNNTY